LDLAALRRCPPSPLPSSGIARRTFLAGAAVAAATSSAATRAAASAISGSKLGVKARKNANGSLRSVTITVDSLHAWMLDTALYDGDPILTLEESASEIVVTLSGAKLPGTDFAVSLRATIRQKLLQRTIELAFSDTGVQPQGFTLQAPFDAWVRGEAPAVAALDREAAAGIFGPNLHRDIQVLPDANLEVSYLPSGAFAFAGAGFDLRTPTRNLGVRHLAIGPRKTDSESMVRSPSSRHTRITAERKGPWAGRLNFRTREGWNLSGSLKGFDRLEGEIHSASESCVTLEGGRGSDLVAACEQGAAFSLCRPRLAELHAVDSKVTALAAKLDEKGSWLTFHGISLEIGPNGDDAEALFATLETPEGAETFGDIQGGIRKASLPLDGAVTRTHMSSLEPVSLLEWNAPQGGGATRPPVTRPPVTPQIRPTPLAGQGVASRLDIQAVPKFRLAPFQLEVHRREDMLALSFEFVNLSLSAGGGAPTLVRSDATKPAYVVVIFPPQSLAEAHFQEGPDGSPQLPTGNAGRRPIPSRLSGESRLVFWVPTSVSSIHFSLAGDDGKGRNGLLDWDRWKPSIAPTAVSGFGGPKIRIDQAFVNPIDSVRTSPRIGLAQGVRITRPPEGENDAGLMASLRKLSARRGPAEQGSVRPGQVRPVVTPPAAGAQTPKTNVATQLGRLAPGVDPTIVFKIIPKGRIEPNALHSQIEMPIRLIVSPHENAGWSHASVLPSEPPANRYALWHTRLGNRVENPAGQTTAIYIYSDDGKSYYRQTAAGTEGPFPVTGSRSGPTIRAIDAMDWVPNTLSSPKPMPDVILEASPQEYVIDYKSRTMLVDSMCWRGVGNADTEPFEVEGLMLTSLGGYLKGEWNWRQPTGWTDGSKPALISWRHVSTLGRDQYIKLVFKGYLFPTGHKAVLTVIAERKFQTTTEGKVVAYMRSRRFVAIRDPLVTFSSAEQLSVGFSSITCLTQQSPILDVFPGSYGSWGGVQTKDEVVLLYSGNAPVYFQMKGVDMDGNVIQWGQAGIFIRSDRNTQVATVQKVVSEWEKQDAANSLPLGYSKRSKLFGQTVAFAPGGGTSPTGEAADGNTSYPVINMMLSGKVNTAGTWTVDAPRWKAVLHKANISAPAVQIMQGKPPMLGAIHLPGEAFDMAELEASMEASGYADGDDGFDVKIPEVFKQNGFGGGNKSQLFLELVEKYGPTFDDVSKTGGLVNPNMLIQGLSKGKGPVGGDLNDLVAGNVDPKKIFNMAQDAAAYLLGAVNIWDILPNPIKIDPGGSDSPYIELLLQFKDGKTKPPTGACVAVKWKPPLQNWPATSTPLFQVREINGQKSPKFTGTGVLELSGSITTEFKGGEKPKLVFKGSLDNFRVDLIAPASFLILDFKKIEFIAEVGKPFDVNVDLEKMTFTGPLTFIQKLQDLVNGNSVATSEGEDGFTPTSMLATQGPGIEVYLDVDETGIRAGLKITLPTVSIGMLAIRNISFGVELNLPFFGDPLSARFNFCERNNTFQIAVMGVTGGGFVAMTVFINGNMTLEAAFEFGGSLSIDLGVASGGVSIMGGIYFRLDIVDDEKECMIEAYLRINGNLSVLGLIRINLEFYLSMTYYSNGNKLVGTASITVEIEILFFSISVGVTVQRQLAGEKSSGSYFFAGPGELPQADQSVKFTEAVSQTQWAQFCEAYA
jgi:hypothetical protein